MAVCNVCFRKCRLDEGQIGFCGGRVCSGDRVRDLNYGRVTALALDPIEKKPLARFYPGSMILSVGVTCAVLFARIMRYPGLRRLCSWPDRMTDSLI